MAITFEHVDCRREGPDLKTAVGLDDLNLRIQAGRFVAVMGAPGSGKTTLLQHLNGLLLPDAGTVTVMDYRLGQRRRTDEAENKQGRRWFHRRKNGGRFVVPPGLRKRVGLVFQFPEQQLFEDTVERDLQFGPLNFGFHEAEAEEAARLAAEQLGLDEEQLGRSPFELSGGQMRKAAIAGVLAADPDLLALDEPASSLDPYSRKELMRLLYRWCRDWGKTIVIVTHRLEEVLPYADEYIVLDAGRCIFQGRAAELLGSPEVMERAGAVVPDSMQLLADIASGLGVAPPASYLDPDEAAAWIMRMLEGGSGLRQ